MLRNINELIGHKIQATDGELGTVEEFYFGDRTWNIRYMVVETGNWLLGRKVLISPSALKAPDWQAKTFPVTLTREQVRNSPDTDTKKTVSRQHEIELQKYYNWPSYPGGDLYGGGMSGGFVLPPVYETMQAAAAAAPARHREDTHLRGTRAVTGYALHAADGAIGHVSDYIIDDCKWSIRYLVVDTGVWLPGRKVLVSPHWIEKVAWETSEVFVALTREAVSLSPEFSETQPVSEDYENALYDHYGRPRFEDAVNADAAAAPGAKT